MYYSNEKISTICEELECGRWMLYKKFDEWNIIRRKMVHKERHNALYDIDITYFDVIDNEHKAYWLGMMASDGFVNDREISLCLQKNDIAHIQKFKEDLKSEHPIKFNKDGNPFLSIVCKHLCKALQHYGLHNHKTWELDIERVAKNVPKEYEHHFIRGLFDGDGSIKYYIYDYIKKPQYHFGYTGLENVCDYVKNKLGLDRKLVHESNQTYTLVTRDVSKILHIYDYLYNDATIYLDRKYDTFKKIQMMTFNDYNKAIS